jgi:hypothetical protein
MLKIKWLEARSRGAPGPVAREYAHVRVGLARGSKGRCTANRFV